MKNQQTNNSQDRLEIIKVLEKLQEGYTKRDVNTLDQYTEELFAKGDDMVILGTSDGEWNLGYQDSRGLVEGDWKYWGNVLIDTQNPEIFFNGDIAWFNTKASVQYNFSNSDKDCDSFLGFVKEYFDKEQWYYNLPDKMKLAEINYVLTHFMQDKKAEERQYRWDIRLTGVLIKENGKWMFRQMQFSLPNTSEYTDERIDEFSYHEKIHLRDLEKLAKFNENKDDDTKTAIRDILRDFNKDYLSSQCPPDKVAAKYFLSQEDVNLIGTSVDKYNGPRKITEAVEVHRSQWGELILNVDEAVVSTHDNTAWMVMLGLVKRTMTFEEAARKEIESIKGLIESQAQSREKLFKIHRNIAAMIKETLRGPEYVLPIRFEGVMLKNQDKWLFHSAQFSFPFNTILEEKTDAATRIK